MSNPFIQANRLCIFRGARKAIRELDIDIHRGEWFGLVGANGSGKTTFLRALTGRLPINAGECRIDGRDLQSDRFKRAEVIEFAPTGDSLPKRLSAHQVFELLDPNWKANLGDMFDILGLHNFDQRPIGSYSAGMRQRTAIACAFVRGKYAVVLDEPFNWLDPVAAHDLRGALREWVTPEKCLITALHDTATLLSGCDRGALLSDGEIVFDLNNEQLTKAKSDMAAFEAEMIARLRAS